MRTVKGKLATIYIKEVDIPLFEWAKKQRQSLSELIAQGLYILRDQGEVAPLKRCIEPKSKG